MDFARYQLRRVIKHQAFPPDVISPRDIAREYIDLSRFPPETEHQFLAEIVNPIVQMAKFMQEPRLSHGHTLVGNTRFTFSELYHFDTVFYVDDSPLLDTTGHKWTLLTKVLMGAVQLVGRQNPPGFNVDFFQARPRNKHKVRNELEAFELLRHPEMPSKITTPDPFEIEVRPYIDPRRVYQTIESGRSHHFKTRL